MTEKLSLDGKWTLRGPRKINIEAVVPGCVHADLKRADLIPDPYFRDNEKRVQWVGEKSWRYRRVFEAPESILKRDRIFLRFQGLDTFAKVTLNGKAIGEANNMFRRWEYDVKPLLKKGENVITVAFDSPMPYARKRQKEHFLWQTGLGHHRLEGGQWIRKEQSNFGWDWGPMIVTMGIWRSVGIYGVDTAEIASVQVQQRFSRGFRKVELEVVSKLSLVDRSKLSARISLIQAGELVSQASVPFTRGRALARLAVVKPRLWWPNGMGEQPLYVLRVDVHDSDGRAVDSWERRIGIRELKVLREKDQWGESFLFTANGQRFFAKGANWIPSDQFDAWGSDQWNRELLLSAQAAHMNMIRVWGGGKYERDDFYDACDELGLCVWQDFMFACSAYPGFDKDFVENVKCEVEQNVVRIRHHACLALWCGNNEMEHIPAILGDEPGQMPWSEYKNLFDKVIGGLVRKHDPQRDYWPSSEHSPVGDRDDPLNPDCGDAHLWKVWNGREPFEWYRSSYHRFCSEFGFQGLPEPSTIETFTLPQDRNITSYVMEQHQRHPVGNSTFVDYILSWFRLPVGFENTVWLSQIIQGMAIKYAVEHWRINKPRCMGALYWQLNDCWQVASWSSLDYFGKWKALHYNARRFFAPLLIAGVEDLETQSVDIHVVSDLLKAKSLQASWQVRDLDGQVLEHGAMPLRIAANGAKRIKTLRLGKWVRTLGERALLVTLKLQDGDELVSENLVTYVRPKHLELCDPCLGVKVKSRGDGSFDVSLSAQRPALWTWLELKGLSASYSDNFLHLMPGERRVIRVTPREKTTLSSLREAVAAHSLYDTYRED